MHLDQSGRQAVLRLSVTNLASAPVPESPQLAAGAQNQGVAPERHSRRSMWTSRTSRSQATSRELSPSAADLGDPLSYSDRFPRVQLVVRGAVAKLTVSALPESEHLAILETARQPLDRLMSCLHRDVPAQGVVVSVPLSTRQCATLHS